MVRGQQQRKAEYLSPSQIDSIREEKQDLENVLKEVSDGAGIGSSGSQVDVGKIKRDIARLNDVIDSGTAPEARGANKDRLAAEEKELERALMEGMPTQWEMRKPSLNPGAVKKHIRWGERNFSNIKRYVEIQRMLRPDEPKSIENLRKER